MDIDDFVIYHINYIVIVYESLTIASNSFQEIKTDLNTKQLEMEMRAQE
jgi:hypothetical protein